MEQKTDFLGNPLKVGDRIVSKAFQEAEFRIGVIFKLTDKMVFAKNENPNRMDIQAYYKNVIKIGD